MSNLEKKQKEKNKMINWQNHNNPYLLVNLILKCYKISNDKSYNYLQNFRIESYDGFYFNAIDNFTWPVNFLVCYLGSDWWPSEKQEERIKKKCTKIKYQEWKRMVIPYQIWQGIILFFNSLQKREWKGMRENYYSLWMVIFFRNVRKYIIPRRFLVTIHTLSFFFFFVKGSFWWILLPFEYDCVWFCPLFFNGMKFQREREKKVCWDCVKLIDF